MGGSNIGIQQAALAGSVQLSRKLTASISSGESVSGRMVSPKVVHEVGVSTPATRDALGLVQVGENLNITKDGVLSVDVATENAGKSIRPKVIQNPLNSQL